MENSQIKESIKGIVAAVACLIAIYVPSFVLTSAIIIKRAAGFSSPVQMAGVAVPLVTAITLCITLTIMITRGRNWPAIYGFQKAGKKAISLSVALGVIFGLLLRGIAMLADLNESQFPGLSIWQKIIFFGIGAACQEEIIFRGLIQTLIQDRIPAVLRIGAHNLPVAVIITASIFALIHFSLLGQGLSLEFTGIVVSGAFVLGILAGWMRAQYASLVPAIIIHALLNLIDSMI
jgi:membrane protease YdiL (CAAX protease family)